MTSENPRLHIYDPKTLALMDQAFAAIWNQVRKDDPFRDYAHDTIIGVSFLVIPGANAPSRCQGTRHWDRRRSPTVGWGGSAPKTDSAAGGTSN